MFLYAFYSVLIMLLSLYFKTVCKLQTYIQMILTHPKIRKFLICMKVTKMPIKDGFLLISQSKTNFWRKKILWEKFSLWTSKKALNIEIVYEKRIFFHNYFLRVLVTPWLLLFRTARHNIVISNHCKSGYVTRIWCLSL